MAEIGYAAAAAASGLVGGMQVPDEAVHAGAAESGWNGRSQ